MDNLMEESDLGSQSPVKGPRRGRVLTEQLIYELESQFGELVKELYEYLKDDERKIAELSGILLYKLPLRLKGMRHHIKYRSVTLQNYDEFFEDLEGLWNFLDYDLLKAIIITYRNKELISKLKVYEKNVEKFCTETTVAEFVKVWRPKFDISHEFEACVTELSLDPVTCKVQDLKCIQKKLKATLPHELAMTAVCLFNIKQSAVSTSLPEFIVHKETESPFSTGDEETGLVPSVQIFSNEGVNEDINQDVGEKEKFLKDLESITEQSGSISRKLAKAIFLGLPESGKSCLILRLIKKYPSKYSPSTGICNSATSVNVEIISGDDPSHHAITIDDQVGEWVETDLDLSLLAHIGKAGKMGTKSSQKFATGFNEDPSLKKTAAQESEQMTSSLSLSHAVPLAVNVESSKRGSLSLSKVVEKYGFKVVKKYLKNSFSIYLIDSGGQVEFQEILPLFISGPCIYFFVFRLDQVWTGSFKVSYRTKDQEQINTYESSSTLEETFLQTMRSIAAIGEDKVGDVQTHPPLVFIIGTHMDLLPSDSIEQKITDLNKYIIELVEVQGFTNLVQYADWTAKRIFFTVNNYSMRSEDFDSIRRRVNGIVVQEDKFTIDYPVSYLQASLDLCNDCHSILNYNECESIALENGIQKGQVKHFLNFLSYRLEMVKYFPVEGLKNLVVRNTQFLFDIVTDLIVKTFIGKNFLLTHELSEFEKKGIITANALKKVSDNFEGIEPKQVLDILVHLRIASIVNSDSDDDERYFLPCVLSHIPPNQSNELESPITPVFIAFRSQHCPKGLLSVLISTLTSLPEWKILPEQIYRNQVSFGVGKYDDKVTLTITVSHLKISVHPFFLKNLPKRMTMFCKEVCKVVDICMQSSLKTLRYSTSKVKYFFGSLCDSCCLVHEPFNDEDEDIIIHCNAKKQFYEVKESARYWFTCSGVQKSSRRTDIPDILKSDEHICKFFSLKGSIPRKELLFQDLKPGEHSCCIAKKMIGWDLRPDLLQLEQSDVHDIKTGINKDNPELQRQEALNKWRNKDIEPNYHNLLAICVEGEWESAKIIVELLTRT